VACVSCAHRDAVSTEWGAALQAAVETQVSPGLSRALLREYGTPHAACAAVAACPIHVYTVEELRYLPLPGRSVVPDLHGGLAKLSRVHPEGASLHTQK